MKKRRSVASMFLAVFVLSISCAIAGSGVNLITNGDFKSTIKKNDMWDWRGDYCYLHNGSPEAKKITANQYKSLVKCSVKDGVASIVKPQALEKICGKFAINVSGGFRKYVKLPNANGGKYKFSMSYKADNIGAGKNILLVSFLNLNEKYPNKGKAVAPLKSLKFPKSVDKFSVYSTVISVPKGAEVLGLVVRIDGIGALEFTDVSLTQL